MIILNGNLRQTLNILLDFNLFFLPNDYHFYFSWKSFKMIRFQGANYLAILDLRPTFTFGYE